MTSYTPVMALLRGLKVLEAISQHGQVSIGELHAQTGIPKPTLVRIIETLSHAGYVYSEGQNAQYALSARCLSLGAGVDRARHLVAQVSDILLEFQKNIPWPSDFGIFDGDAMVIIETSRRPGMLNVYRRAGSRVPVLPTSLGRAYLANVADEAWPGVFAVMRKANMNIDEIKRIRGMAPEIRARGYAISDQEHHPKVRTIAAPVFDKNGVAASLNIIVLAEALKMDELIKLYAESLIDVTKEMSLCLMEKSNGF